MAKLVIVRTRAGTKGSSGQQDETFKRLGMPARFSFTIREDSPVVRGMLRKVAHMATWGFVSEETEKKLASLEKGLHPPRKGFERKGVKMPFAKGGVFGDRAEKMDDLVVRMLP